MAYTITYTTEQISSWETNRFRASKVIHRILREAKVHYRIHICPPVVSILSHIDPIQSTTPHLLNIHRNQPIYT
jgi:hypothetical protein